MEHADWIGIAVLISTVTSSIIAILTAIQSLRNHRAIKDVDEKVNGVVAKAVEEAHKSGILEADARRFREELARRQRPAT